MQDLLLTHLSLLVSCDTQNPPRAITGSDQVFQYCKKILEDAGCVVELTDLGNGCVNLLATRGEPSVLFNCHLDTVPADPAWTRDPFVLAVDETKATGLGACDIKGAAACLLAAAEGTDEPLAILLTSDEEAGDSVCVKHYLSSNPSFASVIVCEPTNAKAVTKHRGIETYELEFSGRATHSSQPTAHADNAIHRAIEWASKAIDYLHKEQNENLRYNIGVISGGVKTNIAASSATVRFGIRQHAETNLQEVGTHLLSFLSHPSHAVLKRCFSAPSLESGDAGKMFIEQFGLEHAGPVDFWTEAALFSEAGFCTLVVGPGDIKEAHAPDESVPLEDLIKTTHVYMKIIQESIAQSSTRSQAAVS